MEEQPSLLSTQTQTGLSAVVGSLQGWRRAYTECPSHALPAGGCWYPVSALLRTNRCQVYSSIETNALSILLQALGCLHTQALAAAASCLLTTSYQLCFATVVAQLSCRQRLWQDQMIRGTGELSRMPFP